jgi:hypothetical protein
MRLLHRTGSALLGFGLLGTPAVAADYHVGPGQALATLGAVPWSTLKAGDTVFVHYQATPYHEKMCISGQGTATSPIRISGVPGPNGEVPVISGANATTSPNCDFHWQDAAGGSAVQWYGVVFVMFAENAASPANKLPPAYIEIANLHIQDGTGSFTTEAGAAATYDPFTACIYARSPQHLTVQNVEMSNCGLGFFNWTGGVDNVNWWEAVAKDITLRNNYFHDNGVVGQFTQHQSYTEALGALIEGNRYGPVRTGMNGSQLKDRSSGSVIRYNSIEAPPNGWVLDLVEPQEAAPVLLADPAFKQTFVYGNLLFASNGRAPDLVHWNEDHQLRQGRADDPASRLFFYNNTIAVTGITGSPLTQYIFNTTYGAFDCDPVAPQGRIDVRNNLVSIAASSGTVPEVRWSYCQDVNIDFATNLVLPVPTTVTHAPGSVVVTGQSNLLSGNPAFVSATDLHVQVASSAAGKGGALAAGVPAVMMPASQYVYDSTSGHSARARDLRRLLIRRRLIRRRRPHPRPRLVRRRRRPLW